MDSHRGPQWCHLRSERHLWENQEKEWLRQRKALRERPQSGNEFDILAKQEGQRGITMWSEHQGQTVVRNVVGEEFGNQVMMEGFLKSEGVQVLFLI